MKRTIVTPAVLAPAALAELKEWLGITIASEDAALTALLRASLESCEAFTGTMALQAVCEEVLPVSFDWLKLQTTPVQAITSLDAVLANGTRTALNAAAYAIDFSADGTGLVRVVDPGLAQRLVVRFTAGLASDWTSLPEGLRHGVLRLAAHHYRLREGDGSEPTPPAAVAALWRPWRRLRLA